MAGELEGIEEDVRFGYSQAEDLVQELTSLASSLSDQASMRGVIAQNALVEWRGPFAEDFRGRTRTCVSDADRLADFCQRLAAFVEELADSARDEQQRREQAREWKRKKDSENFVVRGYHDVVGGDDAPPVPPPRDPPTFTDTASVQGRS